MRKGSVKERVNTNNRININNVDCSEDELKVYKVFDDYYYPSRENIIWRKRKKNLYFASSVLCTVTGVMYCVDIEDYNADKFNDTTTSNKSYFVKKPNSNNIDVVLETKELSLLEKNKEELKEAIEIAKESLENSGQHKSIDLRSNSNSIQDDSNSNVEDAELVEDKVYKTDENESNDKDYYSYNLETKLEETESKTEELITSNRSTKLDTSNAMKYWDYFQYYGYTYGVDPYLLVAIASQESSGNHYETIIGGSKYNGYGYGIMQIEKPGKITTEITAYNHTTQSYDVMHINSEDDVSTVSSNIKAGAMLFAQKSKQNQYNPYVTIQGYNYGLSGVNYAISYYIADGNEDDTNNIFNNKEELKNYISSNNSNWLNYVTSSGLTSREWYSKEGWKKFGLGKGDEKYFENVMRYYSGEDAPYIVSDVGVKYVFK